MRIVLAFVLLLVNHVAWAACSEDYAGLAVINEVADQDGFFEVKILSSAIDADLYTGWTVEYCTIVKVQGTEQAECVGLGDESGLSLPDSDASTYPWVVVSPGTSDPAINLEGIEIRLSDSDGNTIDYLRVADLDSDDPVDDMSQLEDTTCEIGTTLDAGEGNQGKLTMREPDGAGDWNLDPGNSGGGSTSGDTNDGADASALPAITIDNPVVSRGSTAVFTVFLDKAPETDQTVEVAYSTRNGSAVAPGDYTPETGTLVFAAGETSKSISVETGGTPEATAERFYLDLAIPPLADGEVYGATFVSQVGIGEIAPFNPVTTLAGFEVITESLGSVCAPLSVEIRAINGNGDVMTGYEGSVALFTSSDHGTWGLDEAAGSLSPAPDTSDDGRADYQFVAGDNGVASFLLSNTHADILTVSTQDGTANASGTSSRIEFLENVLRISSQDDFGNDLIAGRGHSFEVEMLKRNSEGECGVAGDYQGRFELQAWLERTGSDPGGVGPAIEAATTLTEVPEPDAPATVAMDFENGRSSFFLIAADVGEYTLRLLDSDSGYAKALDGSPLPLPSTTADGPWTVRPFALATLVPDNPGATDANGPVFRKAGEVFSVEVGAMLYDPLDDVDGDGQPDPGADLWDNGRTPSFGQEGEAVTLEASLRAPDPGNNPGLVGDTNPLSSFINGRATSDDFSFPEVGVIELTARVTDNGYLGAGSERTARMVQPDNLVGRFIPDRLELVLADEGRLDAVCTAGITGFTYTGQAFGWQIPPRFRVIPRAVSGDKTLNYLVGGFMKLAASGVDRNWPVADEVATLADGSGGAVPLAADTSEGFLEPRADGDPVFYQYSSGDEFRYLKSSDARIAPFNPTLAFGLASVSDADGVSWSPAVPASDPSPSLFSPDTAGEIRYGRLQMENVYGPENVDELLMPFSAEYWNGSGFVTNTDDSCTPWSTANITDPQAYHSLVADSGSLAAGVGGPLVLEPNGDRGTDTLIWDMPIWLEGDWNQDGALEDPSATATFGVFRGNDRIVYWRER